MPRSEHAKRTDDLLLGAFNKMLGTDLTMADIAEMDANGDLDRLEEKLSAEERGEKVAKKTQKVADHTGLSPRDLIDDDGFAR